MGAIVLGHSGIVRDPDSTPDEPNPQRNRSEIVTNEDKSVARGRRGLPGMEPQQPV